MTVLAATGRVQLVRFPGHEAGAPGSVYCVRVIGDTAAALVFTSRSHRIAREQYETEAYYRRCEGAA